MARKPLSYSRTNSTSHKYEGQWPRAIKVMSRLQLYMIVYFGQLTHFHCSFLPPINHHRHHDFNSCWFYTRDSCLERKREVVDLQENSMKFYPCSVIGNILFFSFFQKSNALLSDSLSRLSFRRYIFLNALLPENYQDVGNELIYEAGKGCGTSEDQLSVVWKGGKVTVTVAGDAFLSVPDDESNSHESGVDVVVLARAINAALDENEIGTRIAETHEIEVTTPGASDELTGVMWDVYRGFDVVAKFIDPKKQVEKTIEGRLHERTEDITIINIKGRMKKIKNGNLLSVMLPKAKTEKGSK